MKLVALIILCAIVLARAKRQIKQRRCAWGEEWTNDSKKCENNCEIVRMEGINTAYPCPQDIDPGCRCKPGFARTEKGLCTREENCLLPVAKPKSKPQGPGSCGKNEVWFHSKLCEKSCAQVREFGIGSVTPCPTIYAPGCICKNGFARDVTNRCVKEKMC